MTRQPHPALVAQLHGKRRFTTEVVGLERGRALQAALPEVHKFPVGQRTLHRETQACPCRVKVKRTNASWWQVAEGTAPALEVEHQVLGPENPEELNAEDWNDLHRQQLKRQR
jgi:hypothetical protein